MKPVHQSSFNSSSLSIFHIVGFCPHFRLWDFVLWDSVLWDFVRRDFVLWDFVLWDSVRIPSGRYLSHTMISDRDNFDHHRQSDIKVWNLYKLITYCYMENIETLAMKFK